jgi:2-polyprenyl-3-methyl-5-hydroxy-6-metoxy-1,4-benzoquinol methylase
MAAVTAYDEVRYSNFPYAQTHPDRLATVAILHGLHPADPARCRVLELGCGAGGNVLAMACATPGLEVLGVDLAATPVAEGRQAIAEVGLENAELRQGDVRDLTEGQLGRFDYVVAHGVYSWVPPDARDALLAAVSSHLAPDGVAYVSYNAYPGGYFRRLLRDAGLWYARGETEAVARVTRAQELYRFLLEHRADEGDAWGAVLAYSLPAFVEGPVYRLVHDDLGDEWHPAWFADFIAHAAEHGLAFVGESDLRQLLPGRVPPDVEGPLRELAGGDRIAYEQHVDLLRCIHFRQTLLCRAGQPVDPELAPERMRRLAFAARPGSDPPADGLLARAHELLRERAPETVPFDELRRALASDAGPLAEALLEGFGAELLMPHAAPLRVAGADAERPVASPLARWQARRGPDVTSLAYANVHMEEPAARLLLTLLDGKRDRAAIRAEFGERTGVRLSAEDLDANLRELARLFLLAEG